MEDLAQLQTVMGSVWPALEVARIKLRNLKIIEESTNEEGHQWCQRDIFAQSLLPPEAKGFVALRTTGDGNCLFNAASISLCGK